MRESILFIDKVLLKPWKEKDPIRGVELFNILLIRDLLACGHPVTLVADASWRPPLQRMLGTKLPECIWTPRACPAGLMPLWIGMRFVGSRYHTLLVGNVANGLIPGLGILKRAGMSRQVVLIAHRETTPRFARLFSNWPGHILAVNSVIARRFIAHGCPNVHVDYGIHNADRFAPATKSSRSSPIHFCVLGAMENPWKGADTAIKAFGMLPEEIKNKAHLHLASYRTPPSMDDDRIIPYVWMPMEDIPRFLQNMDVLIVPSRDEEVMRETFSQATVQGMLSGLPVLHTPLPILTEKFDQGGGACFVSAAELAGLMEKAVKDSDWRINEGQTARAVALDRYVWNTPRFIQRYIAPDREPVEQTIVPPIIPAPLPLQHPAYIGEVAHAWHSPDVLAQLNSITDQLREGTALTSKHDRVVRLSWAIQGQTVDVAVKSYGRQPFLKDWTDRRQGSKAKRSFRAAVHMQAHNVGTPEPIAWLDRWENGRLCESYYVSVYEPDLSAFREELIHLYRHEPDCGKLMQLLQTVAQALAHLHACGCAHRDMGNQNIALRRTSDTTWGDVMFIDLNRACMGAVGSMRKRAFDLSRINLPSDFLRVFMAMYCGEQQVPAALVRFEAMYRRRYAWHTHSRAWRHPIRTRQRRKVKEPDAITYPDVRDVWIWDERSGQAISVLQRKDRKKYYALTASLSVACSTVKAIAPVWFRYKSLRTQSFTVPVSFAHKIGMTLHPRPATWDIERARLDELGPMPVLVRLYHHESSKEWDFTKQCIRELHQAGYPVSLAMVQDRRAITEPARWDAFVHTVLQDMAPLADWVEVGHAINRVKWGLWKMADYARLCKPFADYRQSADAIRCIGPATIDFEYHYTLAALDAVRHIMPFDALSHHLYVDRRGAPENKQGPLDTSDKATLLKAVADYAQACASRVIITEVNWPLLHTGVYSPVCSPYVTPGPRVNDPSVSEEDYARFMIRYLLLTLATGHIERVYWWRLKAHGYGLVDDHISPPRARPAFNALKHFLETVGNATFQQRTISADGVYTWYFTRPDQEQIVIAYAHPDNATYITPFTFDSVQDQAGHEIAIHDHAVNLSGAVTYFRRVTV
jgi:glycosyltransferase involved in cell wall biosynthesis/tRNA A-37 threonylcarbamoyl transferase component Bud32